MDGDYAGKNCKTKVEQQPQRPREKQVTFALSPLTEINSRLYMWDHLDTNVSLYQVLVTL